jgi:hypothetical protein
MCLDKLTKITHKTGKGWKWVRSTYIPETVSSPCYDHTLFRIGIEETDTNKERVWFSDSAEWSHYEAGFHIFVHLFGAIYYGRWEGSHLRRVKYDEVVAEGFDGNTRVVVAKKITILPTFREKYRKFLGIRT